MQYVRVQYIRSDCQVIFFSLPSEKDQCESCSGSKVISEEKNLEVSSIMYGVIILILLPILDDCNVCTIAG